MSHKKHRISQTTKLSPTPHKDVYETRDGPLSIARAAVIHRPRGVFANIFHNFNPTEFLSHVRQEVEDLRRWQPRPRNARLPEQRQYRLDNAQRSEWRYGLGREMLRLQSPMRLQFLRPRTTLVCVRRQARRRVLFALSLLRKKGRGGGAKKARWSAQSFIQCRRVR